MVFLEIAGGIVLLLVGGELLVRGAVLVAERFGVSPLVIGLTLVGFGTSAPELVTSIDAALMGAPGIAIGNIVGSNIANVLIIIALAALISPIVCDIRPILREGCVMLAASALLTVIVLYGTLSRPSGAVLFAGLLAYLAYAWMNGRRDAATAIANGTAAAAPPRTGSIFRAIAMPIATAVAGLLLVVFGADLLVRGSVAIAESAGVSQTIIGLTIVAIGTSLPELVTSVMAAFRGQSDIAVGNIIGSNIFNIFGIAGLTAIVHPITIDAEIAQFDIWVMNAAAIALVVAALSAGRINRLEGGALFAAYGVYVAVLLN